MSTRRERLELFESPLQLLEPLDDRAGQRETQFIGF